MLESRQAIALLLFFLVLTEANKTVLEQQARTPVTDVHTIEDNFPQLLLGEDLSIDYPGIYSEFEYKVLKRKSATRGNVFDDYQLHSNSYEDTQLCRLQESNLKTDVTARYHFTNTDIRQLQIDTARGFLYLLTKSSEVLVLEYEAAQTGLHFKNTHYKLVDIPNADDSPISFHFESTTYSLLYILTKESIFMVDPEEPNPVLNPVKGLHSVLNNTKAIWQDKYLILNSRHEVSIYEIDHPNEISLIQTVRMYEHSKLTIVDAWIDEAELWLLDEEFGLYHYINHNNVYVEKESYRIRYGQKLFFRRLGTTFQVGFELRKQIYIAELNLHDEQLYLNRFYTQVPGAKDILFLNELMMIVGDQQAMFIQHSISLANLNHYLVREGSWQRKQFINTYGVHDTRILEIPEYSTQETGLIVTITDSALEVHKLSRSFASLRCLFNSSELIGKHTFHITINATTCKSEALEVSIGRYCQVEHSVNFNILSPTTKAESVIIGYSLLGGMSFAALVVCLCIVRYRAKKKHEVTELRGVLKRKIEEVMYHKPGSENL